MPTAFEKRLDQLEELVHPGAKQRAEVVQRTAAERSQLAADFAAVTDRRSKADAAHPAAVRDLRAALVVALAANRALRAVESRIEDDVAAQRELVRRGHDAEIDAYVPRAAVQDFEYLVASLDGDVVQIARRAATK